MEAGAGQPPVDLNFEAWGEPGRLPVVLLHAFPLDRRTWEAQLDLSDAYRLIVPDLRGFGRSPAPLGPYSVDGMAADVLRLLDRLNVHEFACVGLSMGGYVALALAGQAGHRLRGLCLADSRIDADPHERRRGRERFIARLEAEGSGWVADQVLPNLLSEPTRRERPGLVTRLKEVIGDQSADGLAGAVRAIADRPDRAPAFENLDVPVLVVVGDEDPLVSVADAEETRERARDGELVVVDGASHLSPVEGAERFNEALRAHLDRVVRSVEAR